MDSFKNHILILFLESNLIVWL